MRRFLRIGLGSLCILLGLAGLVLPILQGWLFLGLGGVILSRDVPLVGRMVDWITVRIRSVGRKMGMRRIGRSAARRAGEPSP